MLVNMLTRVLCPWRSKSFQTPVGRILSSCNQKKTFSPVEHPQVHYDCCGTLGTQRQHGTSSAATSPQSSNFNHLLMLSSTGNQLLFSPRVQAYILPGSIDSVTNKKTIVDPQICPSLYKLPPVHNISPEKLTPGLLNIVPKVDPHRQQQHVDEGSVDIRKMTMPYLIRIRHRKMKKHKLKKFRKRMIFLHRKLKEVKKKKKEKVIIEYQQACRQDAEAYDAEQVIDEELRLARKGGYTVNILATRGRDQ